MKNIKNSLLLMIISFLSLTSCSKDETFTADPYKNFDALWTIMDNRYCFFEEKGIDWDKVGDKYRAKLKPVMSDDELFDVMTKMLGELKDGHVNLSSNFNRSSSYDAITEGYPNNYNAKVAKKYQTDTKYAGGLAYNKISYNNHEEDYVGLIVYRSFMDPIDSNYLDEIFKRFDSCKALIIDIRNNGGGAMLYSDYFASKFTKERTLVGYVNHKTNKGRNDFSKLYEVYLDPAIKGVIWEKPVVVLTDRGVYSAANDFASKMKNFSNVTLLGGRTGGGGGIPSSNRLPNGWRVRFSASPMYDINKKSTEDGINPDKFVDLKSEDVDNDIDTLIEEAINYLNEL